MSESEEFEYLRSTTDAIWARELCENFEADAIEFLNCRSQLPPVWSQGVWRWSSSLTRVLRTSR
jgi:hypothetical protein